MSLENIKDRLFPKKENTISVEEVVKKFGIDKYELGKDKDGKPIIWLHDMDYATSKLAELVTSIKPKEVDCAMGRSDDAGTYAKITFMLLDSIKTTGTVFFSNYLGNFSKVLTELGYKKTNWSDLLEQGTYALEVEEK